MVFYECSRFSPYVMPSRLWNRGFFDEVNFPWELQYSQRRPGPLRVFYIGSEPNDKRVKRGEKKKQLWSETFSIGDRFDPENVTIKTADDTVTITAKRERRHEDDVSEGHTLEQMTRLVKLPKDVSSESVKAYISSDGDLKLIGRRKNAIASCQGCADPAVKDKSSDCKTPKSLAQEALSDTEENKETKELTDTTTSQELPGDDEMETSKTPEQTSEENVKAEMSMDEIAETEVIEPWSMQLNLEGFQPADLSVKIKGNLLTVAGKHEEEKDGLYSSRQIRKAFTLPKNVNPIQLSSHFEESGNLRLTAPIMQAVEYTPEERELAIQQENTLAVENDK